MLKANDRPTILVFGFGNPGRQDDGLGIALVDRLESMGIPFCSFEQNYQLNAEDALLISGFDTVIFADASLTVDSYSLAPIVPAIEIGFTTHSMHPASVVALCNELYSIFPKCYLLEMRGFEFEMKEGLSEGAMENLQKALDAVVPLLNSGTIVALNSDV